MDRLGDELGSCREDLGNRQSRGHRHSWPPSSDGRPRVCCLDRAFARRQTPAPLRLRVFGGEGAEGMKKRFPSSDCWIFGIYWPQEHKEQAGDEYRKQVQ